MAKCILLLVAALAAVAKADGPAPSPPPSPWKRINGAISPRRAGDSVVIGATSPGQGPQMVLTPNNGIQGARGLNIDSTSPEVRFGGYGAAAGPLSPYTLGGWNMGLDQAAAVPLRDLNAIGKAIAFSVTDAATTLGSTTLTSVQANFTTTIWGGEDPNGTPVGATVTGEGIPTGTTIVSVTDPSHVEMSAPATATATNVRAGFNKIGWSNIDLFYIRHQGFGRAIAEARFDLIMAGNTCLQYSGGDYTAMDTQLCRILPGAMELRDGAGNAILTFNSGTGNNTFRTATDNTSIFVLQQNSANAVAFSGVLNKTGVAGLATKNLAWTSSSGSSDMSFSPSTNGANALVLKANGNNIVGSTSDTGSGAKLQVSGTGMQIIGAAQPACDTTHAGLLWYSGHTAGVKDGVAICAADASNAYAWRTIY